MKASPTDLSEWRRRCLEWQSRDLRKALSRFTFIADLTTLSADCRFNGDGDCLAARYEALPFHALAFHGSDPAKLAGLTRSLFSPDEEFYCLLADEQLALARQAFRISETREEWQMIFDGKPPSLDPGNARELGPADLAEMKALAQAEDMMAFEADPLPRGPWSGIRHSGRLIAQGGTHVMLDRAAEIGNIVTAREHRRQGLASQVTAALVRALHDRGRTSFLHVFKDNEGAAACYERLGFERLRTMFLIRCRTA